MIGIVLLSGCQTAGDALNDATTASAQPVEPAGAFSWDRDTLSDWLTADEMQRVIESLSTEYSGESAGTEGVRVHRNLLQETEPPPGSRFQDWTYDSRPAGWTVGVTEIRDWIPRRGVEVEGLPPDVFVWGPSYGAYVFSGPHSTEVILVSVFPPEGLRVSGGPEDPDWESAPPEMVFDAAEEILVELGWLDRVSTDDA